MAFYFLSAPPVSRADSVLTDSSWVTQEATPWTVNLAGNWQIRLCSDKHPSGPTLVSVTVRQEGRRIFAEDAQNNLQLTGRVSGHHVSFAVSGITHLQCMADHALLKFEGEAKGAFISGQFSAPSENGSGKAISQSFSAQLHREFMLSFDDGPLPDKTDRVLDTLAHFKGEDGKPVRAAFFMLGDAPDSFWRRKLFYAPYEIWTDKGSMAKYPELVARAIREGHWIANHTEHHAWFYWPWLDDTTDITGEFNAWERTRAALGIQSQPKLFRPPYLINTQAVQAAAAQLNYRIVLGNTAGDATPGSNPDYVKQHSLKIMETWDQSTPAVLIFHDTLPVTYLHLDEIITYLQHQGYVLVHFK